MALTRQVESEWLAVNLKAIRISSRSIQRCMGRPSCLYRRRSAGAGEEGGGSFAKAWPTIVKRLYHQWVVSYNNEICIHMFISLCQEVLP